MKIIYNIYMYIYIYMIIKIYYGPGHNYRTEVEEYESTVVYRTIPYRCSRIPVSLERLRTLEKTYFQLTPVSLNVCRSFSFYSSCCVP